MTKDPVATTPVTLLRVGCKINLTLRIVGVRQNGWHELDTLFVPLDAPHDELVLAPAACAGLTVRCSVPEIDAHKNTLTSAYAAFADATGFRPALMATLSKGIPHGAGLGGGSADAAALLLWLNAHCPRALALADLVTVAGAVGADVAFFLYNRPCRGTGTGAILEPSDCLDRLGLRGMELVLLCPSIHVSTPCAYAAWDRWQKKTDRDLTGASAPCIYRPSRCFLKEERGAALSAEPLWLENSFEVPVFEEHPRLRHLKEQLLQAGACAAGMSGSGSALFGLFRAGDTTAFVETLGKDVAVYRHAL
ncbi:MAG: 4-(cytidine 5'-diphospho)-2-C-methyl-D-erythritol kinase [Bilophila sp.]